MNNCLIGGTVFPHKENMDITKWPHYYQWKMETLIRKCCRSTGADVGSDHHILLGKIKMHLRKALKRSEPTRTNVPLHTAKLRDPGVQKKFSLTPRNRFQTLWDIGDGFENNWNAFRDIIKQTSADVLGTKTRSDKDWIQLD